MIEEDLLTHVIEVSFGYRLVLERPPDERTVGFEHLPRSHEILGWCALERESSCAVTDSVSDVTPG